MNIEINEEEKSLLLRSLASQKELIACLIEGFKETEIKCEKGKRNIVLIEKLMCRLETLK